MKNKLTLTEQEELFVKDCKLINLKYEYNGYTGAERWAIITELSVKELWEKYPLVIERYSPFVHLSIAQGEVIDDANRNEDKYAKRSSRTLDCYGYDDEMSSQFHKELKCSTFFTAGFVFLCSLTIFFISCVAWTTATEHTTSRNTTMIWFYYR